MKIILNGKSEDLTQSVSLKSFIEQFCQNPQHIIAELNGQIVKSPDWDARALKDGDALELISFVGGG